jgi:TrwC relaxase
VGVEPGAQVTEEHLFRMLGMVQDPLTGEQLGRPPRAQKALYAERVRTRINAETAGPKGDEQDAHVLKIKSEERAVEVKAARAVAGFDLTFSAPKSISVAWALADGGTQAVIYEAHQQAQVYVLGYAVQCVFTSRSGKNGVVQEEIRGVVGAAFDHWDSRAGDPQLHTPVVVMNRAQSEDGVWRTLDSPGHVPRHGGPVRDVRRGPVRLPYARSGLGVGVERAASLPGPEVRSCGCPGGAAKRVLQSVD